MFIKPIAVAGLAVAVILAAGAGAYLAVRHNVALLQPAADRLTPEGTAVDMTEAVVSNSTAAEPFEPLAAVPAAGTREPVSATVPVSTPAPVAPAAPPAPVAPVAIESTVAPSVPAEPAAALAPPVPPPARPRPDPPATDSSSSAASAPPATDTAAAGAGVPDGSAPNRAADRAATTRDDLPEVQAADGDLPVIDGWSRAEGVANRDAPAAPEPVAAELDVTNLLETAAAGDAAPGFIEYELAADSVIGLQVDTAVSTRTARVEDAVEARVTRNVLVGDQVAVPAGARMLGSVVLVEQGGTLRDASRLGVRFHTLVMDGGPGLPVLTETIYREGKPEGGDSVAKIGGAAVGGAILGAIFGGSRGAAIGGSIGAAGGTAAALNNEAEPASLPPGTMLTVRLSRPVIVTVER